MTDHQSQLLELEQQLQHKLARIHADFANQPSADSSERATERENDEVLNQLERQAANQLQQVQAALQAIAAGHYGRCNHCGQVIPAERLNALPYSLQCQHCA